MGDDIALNEKPSEFFQSLSTTGGYCDGQAVLPEGDHYIAVCSCGQWEAEAPTQQEGLHLCRVHTGNATA